MTIKFFKVALNFILCFFAFCFFQGGIKFYELHAFSCKSNDYEGPLQSRCGSLDLVCKIDKSPRGFIFA